MIEIPTDLPAELVPLSWLIGVWEGTGVIDYAIGDEGDPGAEGTGDADSATGGEAAGEPGAGARVSREFGQRISFSHDGLPYLNYSSYTWLLGEKTDDSDETPPIPLTAETGYWRLSRLHIEGDVGPGMLPGVGPRPFNTAQSVEALRNSSDGFDIEVSIVHPTGVSELYLGQVKGPRIDLATDAVVRTQSAKEYSAATRLYGLVDNHLLWAWDIAALGQSLRTHASARLAKAD
ncbi:nitrobindin family protein [Herbiconiux daphne]|uniref:Peroxynitrite isomerase n=1 Tax=Herbiconiux daphne TaxID=2970914 RepID=A0ABT2GXK4_9MICO|nr:FABP family protein [Herbiconiux daphne]MCS5732698.1 FABP family protein [Herbiconiux daphne]